MHLTSDNYTGRGCQTLNDVVKSKDVQAVLFTQNSVGVQATNWDIYDANQELLEANEAQEVYVFTDCEYLSDHCSLWLQVCSRG